MLNEHLSDEQIQELAINSDSVGAAHAANCPDCKIRLENYKLLMNAIEEEEAPVFNFDLAAAVVAEIESPPAKPRGLWWLCVITIAVILAVAGIYFGEYMRELYNGIKSLAVYFIAITGIILGIVLVIAQYKTYQLKFKMLDMQ